MCLTLRFGGICRCPHKRGGLCNSFMHIVRRLTVKLSLGTMRPLGLRIELWRLNSLSILKTRGRRSLPSGVGLHPAPPLGCCALRCDAMAASACRCPEGSVSCLCIMLAGADEYELICISCKNPLRRMLLCKMQRARAPSAMSDLSRGLRHSWQEERPKVVPAEQHAPTSNIPQACWAVKAIDNLHLHLHLHSGSGNSTMCAVSMPDRKGLSQ